MHIKQIYYIKNYIPNWQQNERGEDELLAKQLADLFVTHLHNQGLNKMRNWSYLNVSTEY